jgi:hypothetical protein
MKHFTEDQKIGASLLILGIILLGSYFIAQFFQSL